MNRYVASIPRLANRPKPFSTQAYGMTDAERELDPYNDYLMEEELKERRWMKPVQWIFDRLQTGQYISANVAEELIKAFENNPEDQPQFLRAIKEGITGERKGSYETLLRDRLNVGTRKLFQNAKEGSRWAELDWAHVLGFIGDVILDPTTYMAGPGLSLKAKATKGAKAAAAEYADDAVRLLLRQMAEEPGRIIAGAMDPAKTQKLMTAAGKIDPKQLQRVIAIADTNRGISKLRGLGDDMGRFIDLTYREAYRMGLTRSQDELVKLTSRAVEGLGDPQGAVAIADLAGMGGKYQGAGERFGVRVFGKELGKHQTSRTAADVWDKAARLFGGTPDDPTKLRKALWGAWNRGPIGEIRRALGFRNPYQKYLRAMELENTVSGANVAVSDALQKSVGKLKDLDDNQIKMALDLMSKKETAIKAGFAEHAEAGSLITGAMAPTKESVVSRAAALSSGDPMVDKVVDDLRLTLDNWYAEESHWAHALNETVAQQREWYTPTRYRDTNASTQVRRPRKYTYAEGYQREVDLQKAIWNVDDNVAKQIVDANVSGFSVDFRETLAERALVHGKTKARYDLFQQVKEFGIDLADSQDPVAQALLRGGRDIKALGLKNIDLPAFTLPDGSPRFVFDYDVADIIGRAMKMSGQESNIFRDTMKRFATWWKGMATATPGFHWRNHFSNTVTQYLRHGVRAFNPDEIAMSAVGVHYALKSVDAQSYLKAMNFDEGVMEKYLNRRIGNLTLRELAEEAKRLGVISEATMGFDPTDITKTISRAARREKMGAGAKAAESLLPANQPLRSASRAIGNYVENLPRFQSFLIDYADTFVPVEKINVGQFGKDAIENALRLADEPRLKQAALEAKTWFIDYTNLTDFERGTLKNVIPFYSWLRNNLANQLSGIVLYPDLYSILPKLEELVTLDDPEYDETLLPDWLREAGAFPVRREESGAFRMFRPDFAHMDLNLLPFSWVPGQVFPKFTPEEAKDEIINATAPWLRRAADWMMDSKNAYNFFYRDDMGPTAVAPYAFRLFASQPGVVPLVDGFLRFMGYENGAMVDEKDGKLRIDSRMALLMQENLPVLRQFEFLFYLPNTAIPGFQEMLERHTMAPSPYEGAEQVFQLLSYYLGIKFKETDLEAEKMKLGRDIYYQAREALTEQNRSAPGADIRRLQNQQRVDQTVRRLNAW